MYNKNKTTEVINLGKNISKILVNIFRDNLFLYEIEQLANFKVFINYDDERYFLIVIAAKVKK